MTRRPLTAKQREEQGCRCQECGWRYRVDIMIPDHLWEKIKPQGKAEGAGLLCGRCIAAALESLGEFQAYKLEVA